MLVCERGFLQAPSSRLEPWHGPPQLPAPSRQGQGEAPSSPRRFCCTFQRPQKAFIPLQPGPPVTVMAAGSAGSDCHVCLFFLQQKTAGPTPPPPPPHPGQCPLSCPCPSSSRFVFFPPRSVGMGCMSVLYAGTTTTF